jgi:hypothetical protein
MENSDLQPSKAGEVNVTAQENRERERERDRKRERERGERELPLLLCDVLALNRLGDICSQW